MVKKENKKYKCFYCDSKGFEFEQEVGIGGSATGTTDKRFRVSDQVKCPQCGNFLPTFKFKNMRR